MPVPTVKESYVDVLVIGAGPSGLMCAHALAKAGENVRIVDQSPTKVMAGHADGIQPRTIEILQSYGLADRLLAEGAQMHMAAFYNPSASGGIERTGRTADAPAPSARFPFKVTLNQGAIESIFLDSMARMGVHVERPVEPASILLATDEAVLKDPQAYAATVVLRNLAAEPGQPDTEMVHAKFVVGADGAHSWVRKTFNIDMEGEQTNFIWGVIDTVPTTDFPDIRNRCAIHSHNGSCMIIPREGDTVRLYVQVNPADVVDPETGRVDRARVGPERLVQIAKKTFYPYAMHADRFDWWTIYIIGQRVAARFAVNERVFIAGDACHTHSPKAGQGMNASMSDTHNLAWKLSHVLRGWADMSLLETYEFERRKYAQELIAFDKQFSALFSGKPRTDDNEDGVSHEQFLAAFNAYGGFTSGIGVHYGPSAVTNTQHQALASNLIIGERMLPHVFIRAADARPYNIQDMLPADTRFKLLVFAGDTSDACQLARVRTLAEAVEHPGSFYAKFGGQDPMQVFDIISISSATKERVDYTDMPPVFRTHWSKVLLDDTDMFEREGGGGYDKYGIDPVQGAIVVVRPDGYIGTVAPYESVGELEGYFGGFMCATV